MAQVNKNNSATLVGFFIAILGALTLIDFENFVIARDWYKLITPLATAVMGWLMSFNSKSLNRKAKNGTKTY